MNAIPRALVVEDDASWQQILVELLTDAGLRVDLADDLPQALALIAQYAHRLAVVDLSLEANDPHNQDGLQVIKALQERDPGCQAILLTGFATVEIAVSALTELGAYTCLRKEMFQRSQFGEMIRRALAVPPASLLPDEALKAQKVFQRLEGNLTALVVEDEAGWQNILAELLTDLGFRLCLTRSYGEAYGRLQRESFTVAVIDLALRGGKLPAAGENEIALDGYRLLEILQTSATPVVIVSGAVSPEVIEKSFLEGIFAFLEKQTFDRNAFRQVIWEAVQFRRRASEVERLTEREKDVLKLLAQGFTNKEIAEALVITPNTVKRHLKSIFEKLNLHTRSAAAAWAANWLGVKSA